ncbi:hypothetical protein NL676_036449 [Syzygium grande]|nr:hypothetical protein NL676_036449 [Syzygium grande]
MVDSLDNLQNKEKRIVGLLRTLGSFVADCWCNHRSAEASPISDGGDPQPRISTVGSQTSSIRAAKQKFSSSWLGVDPAKGHGNATRLGLDWCSWYAAARREGIRSKAYSS